MSMMGFAQIQHGYVKTIGRLSNGEVVPGQFVSGATIQIKDRTAVVSGDKGSFSFPIPDKTYMIQQVLKQGYVLTDPDFLSHQYTYSTNPLIILMADQAEQAAYRRSIEKSVRDKLYSDLENRITDLEKQLEQKKITEEKYRELLMKLDNEYTTKEKIVKDMADRFSKIDFDSVNDFDRRFSDAILNGRLSEADSLLKTKGSIGKRTEELVRITEANTAMQQTLDLSEAMETRLRNELAEDCYKWFSLLQLSYQHDSAAYYIKLRADLDTTNVEWQNDAGKFLFDYLSDYVGSEKYYSRSMNVHLAMGESAKLDLAEDYSRVGETYYYRRQKAQTIKYCEESLSIREQLLGEDHPLTAESYNNLGLLTNHSLILKAIRIVENMPGDTLPELAQYYENYAGVSLIPNGYYQQAMVFYLLPALDICKKNYGSESLRTADSYKSIGDLYYKQSNSVMSRWWHDGPNALDAYHNALSRYEKIYGPKHLKVADIHMYMGRVYLVLAQNNKISGDIRTAMGYYEIAKEETNKAIEIYQDYEKKFGTPPDLMDLAKNLLTEIQDDLSEKTISFISEWIDNPSENKAWSYYDLGINHYDCGNNSQALICFNTSLELFEDLNGKWSTFMPDIYYHLGCLHFYQGDTIQAQSYFDKSISSSMVQNAPKIYLNLGDFYEKNGYYDKALEYYQNTISHMDPDDWMLFYDDDDQQSGTFYKMGITVHTNELLNSDNEQIDDLASIYERLVRVYEHQGKYDLAIAFCDSIKTVNIWENPDITLNAYHKKSQLYVLKGDMDNALKCYNDALSELSDPIQQAMIHENMGLLYCDYGQTKQAKTELKTAKKIRENIDYQYDSQREISLAQSNLAFGKYYTCISDSTQAIECFREAYGAFYHYCGKKSLALAECCEYAGEMYAAFLNYNGALACYEEAYILVLNGKGMYDSDAIRLKKRLDELEKEKKRNNKG